MSEILSWKSVKTRRVHKCWGCYKTYPAGKEMIRASYADGGTAETVYWCETCREYMKRYFRYGDDCGCGEIYANDKEAWEAIKAELEVSE